MRDYKGIFTDVGESISRNSRMFASYAKEDISYYSKTFATDCKNFFSYINPLSLETNFDRGMTIFWYIAGSTAIGAGIHGMTQGKPMETAVGIGNSIFGILILSNEINKTYRFNKLKRSLKSSRNLTTVENLD